MTFKKKMLIAISSFVVVVAFLIVGAFALKRASFDIGGNISFVATGIEATISKGQTSQTAVWENSNDAQSKMKEVVLNTYKNEASLLQEFQSWQGLEFNFNSDAEDIVLSFTITNTSEKADEYLMVSVDITADTISNVVASMKNSSVLIAPNGGSHDFEITFKVLEKDSSAKMLNFAVVFDMQYQLPYKVDADGKSLDGVYDFSISGSEASLVKCNGYDKSRLILPSMIQMPDSTLYDVTSIVDNTEVNGAFYGLSAIEYLAIPNTYTRLGNHAFFNCSGLKALNIPASVTSISETAFNNCSGLEKISVDTANEVYSDGNGKNAIIINSSNRFFLGCKNSEIPDTTTAFSSRAFYGCSGLKKVVIPEGVLKLASTLFGGCTSLEEVILPSTLTGIEGWVFSNCSSLKSITIPASLTSIGNKAFSGCSALKKVIINNKAVAESETMLTTLLANNATKTVYIEKCENLSVSSYLQTKGFALAVQDLAGYLKYTRP